MQQIADFHIHSRFSRACSKNLTIKNLDQTGRIKGVQIIGTGDFTHPEWYSELRGELVEYKNSVIPAQAGILGDEKNKDSRLRGNDTTTGLYIYKNAQDDKIKFTLTSEVALIYRDSLSPSLDSGVLQKVRRIHLVIHGPNLEAVDELNKVLGRKFNLRSDGRPILGISAPEFVKLVLSVHPDFLIYPAHIWTPWFSVFGSKSGFNSFDECFGDQAKHIYAYETGLSSDPEMNRRVSQLDKYTMLSNSDAHSLQNIGREANILELQDFTYNEIYQAIKNNDKKKIKGTIEYYPEGGMYHYDGHRDCGICFSPVETKKHNNLCPVCKRPIVVGVENRVEELADRKIDYKPKNARKVIKLIELDKIICQAVEIKSRDSKAVQKIYNELIAEFDNEFNILMNVSVKDIKKVAGEKVAEGVRRMRAGEVILKPGFDGQYGEVRVY